MTRLKMVWLPLKKWISFLPIAIILYILLQYLVYQPEFRVSSPERAAFIGEGKLLNLSNSLPNIDDQKVSTNATANGNNFRTQKGSLIFPKYHDSGRRESFRHIQNVANPQKDDTINVVESKPEIFPDTNGLLHVDHTNVKFVDKLIDNTGYQQESIETHNDALNVNTSTNKSNFSQLHEPNTSQKLHKEQTNLSTLGFSINPKHVPVLNKIASISAKNSHSLQPTEHQQPIEVNRDVQPMVNDSASFGTKERLIVDVDSTRTHNVAKKDSLDDANDHSVSISSSTVERSARASISSNKVNNEKPINTMVQNSQPSSRVLAGTNMNTIDEKVNVKNVKNPESLPNTSNKDTPSNKLHAQQSEVKTSRQPINTKKVIRKVNKAEISKNKRKAKRRYSIDYLHGTIKVGDKYDKGFNVPQEETCPNNGRDLRVMILVTTAANHEQHRNAIRQTWGHFSMRKDISIVFLVGRPDKVELQNIIDKENDRYGDIIQANFVDVYANLTLKTVSMFEWLNTYCSEVRFILKTDDDMYINVPLLLAFIYTKRNDKRSIYGRLARNWKPVRNKKSKYYIAKDIYSNIKYPEFLTGPAYLFTNDVAEDLYMKALDSTFFKLEDVFTTGLLAESLEIKRVGDSHFRNEKISLKDTCKLMQTISIHMVKYEEEFDIYKRTLDGKTKCKIK